MSVSTFVRRELEEQAEEYETMYEKRFKLLQQSVKKANSRKRRRQDDGELVISVCLNYRYCHNKNQG